MRSILPRLRSPFVVAIAGGLLVSFVARAGADTVPQVLPFGQNWINTSLITLDDDWSNVPGVVGFKDDLALSTGIDPQTILAPQSALDVIANQTNPNTLVTGGVAEFHLSNTVVALQGSGTADAPNVVITFDATGLSYIHVAYVLRDLDGSADNAVTPVALQYRIGNVGNFTNLSAGFVADATSGPSLSGLETPVSVVLPIEVSGQPFVQVRIITSNAAGSDEWVGIDDILIESGSEPVAACFADPGTAPPGQPMFFTALVSPGTHPTSTGLEVRCDMSPIGGSAFQLLYDDGTTGDETPGDNVFSLATNIAAQTTPGPKILLVTIQDAQGRSSNSIFEVEVIAEVGVPRGGDPAALFVRPAYPNPFRTETSFAYELPRSSSVRLQLFDLRGRLVITLEDRADAPAGRHVATWSGKDSGGRAVAPGLYVCRLTTDQAQATQRVMVVR